MQRKGWQELPRNHRMTPIKEDNVKARTASIVEQRG